ncbi:MAG: PAS domain S-box protein [Methylotenera sp.]|nr:PAS domain S-box protein [Methylotenera sp.]MDP2153150.1 PAS domain S-box protein [Methylotenera sp.]MDP3059806.1 PAS domain S-box protein [Methylotenera sp.]
MPVINSFLLNAGLLPHGFCINWTPALLWLYVASDALIVLAYYSILITLIYFVLRRKDLQLNWIFLLFGAFILACGTTHLIGIITLWKPIYWLDASIKSVTAVLSVFTAFALIKLMPQALKIPSISQLKAEVESRLQTNKKLSASKELLVETVKELEARASERLKELSQREEDQRSLLEAIPDALFELDIDGRYYNAHFPRLDLSSSNPDQYIGKTVSEVYPLEAAEIVLSALHEASKLGISRGKKIELSLAQDSLWFELSVAVKNMPNLEKPRFIILSRNITQRKLRENDLRIAAIAFDTQEGILITNNNNQIIRLNDALTNITGYSSEEILGQNPRFLSLSQQDEVFYSDMWLTINTKGKWDGDLEGERKNGEKYPQHLSISAVNDAQGRVINYVYTLIDNTEIKHDERLRLTNEVEFRNTLIREVHHRIKNNLQGVTGFLSQFADEHPEATSAVNKVITQIQSISFIHGLQGSSTEGKVELSSLITSIVAGIESVWKTHITVECDEFCKSINILEVESVPLALVLNEIITNAVKYGKKNTCIKISPGQEIFPISIKVEIMNTGQVPYGFGLQRSKDLGTGLQLAKLLLPKLGSKLSWKQSGDNVLTTLLLYPPVIQVKPHHITSQFKLT